MKKTHLAFLITLLSFIGFSQNPSFEWAKQIGGNNFDNATSVTTDKDDNVYTAGMFTSTVDFDPGPGVHNLTAAGEYDVFVQKLDSSGSFVWAKRIGGSIFERPRSIATDGNRNVYLTGQFQGTVDFDPGSSVNSLTSSGSADIYILKLDSAGSFLWVKKIGSSLTDIGYSITLDHNGNIYTTGSFRGTVDFDPGLGAQNLTATSGDAFVLKLDPAGNFVWAKQISGNSFEVGRSIATDKSGNVYTTGYFFDSVDFDPGIGVLNLTADGFFEDAFIQKLDPNGNLLWAKRMGGSSFDDGRSITVDRYNNVYTTGYFSLTVDFDPGVGVQNLNSAGGADIFVQKLDSAGNFLWAKPIGGTARDFGNAIAVDTLANVYISGQFQATIDFDPGSGTRTLSSPSGNDDIFILKLNPEGDFAWAERMGGFNNDIGYAITVSKRDYVYTAGGFNGLVDFDPGTDTLNLNSVLGGDGFVHKMSQCITSGTDTRTECSPYTWIDGNVYTNSNNTAFYNIIGGAASGCDSLVSLNLTINNVSDITTSLSGKTITANNSNATYQWLDCDSNYAPIIGETNKDFMAISDGRYAVQINENGCVDTSACVVINTIGLNDLWGTSFALYPNPTDGKLIIDFESALNEVEIHIVDAQGRTINSYHFRDTDHVNLDIDSPAGVYLLQIKTPQGRKSLTFVKQ